MVIGQSPVARKTGQETYKELPINRIINADALQEMQRFPSVSVDLVVTNPPYGLK